MEKIIKTRVFWVLTTLNALVEAQWWYQLICLSQFPRASVWWVGSKSCKVILLDNLTASGRKFEFVVDELKKGQRYFILLDDQICTRFWSEMYRFHYAGVVWMNKITRTCSYSGVQFEFWSRAPRLIDIIHWNWFWTVFRGGSEIWAS